MDDGMIRAQRRTFSYVGITMFVMIIIASVLQIVTGVILEMVSPGLIDNSWVMYAVLLVPQYLIAMPIAALMLRQTPVFPAARRLLSLRHMLMIFLICYFIMYAGSLVGTLATSAIDLAMNRQMTDLLEGLLSGSDIWATFVATTLLAPVAEELFYRKLVIGRLGVYGERAAVITSALIFGLAHGNLSQVFYAFGLGLALGYVYIKTRRVIYTIILHMMINLIGGVLAPMVLDSGQTIWAGVFGAVVLGLVIAGLVLFIRNVKRVTFAPSPLMQKQWAGPALLNVGMILFFVVAVVLIVYSTIAAYAPTADYSASVSYVFL